MFNFESKNNKVVKVANVASVPQRSPFRYPGGKTWLIPTVRKWLKQSKNELLIEPFAGGGIVSLTAAFESLADKVMMVELDEQVASVWDVIINGDCEWLADKIYGFNLTAESANTAFQKENKTLEDKAFCTILRNRIFHGGILAKGSGLIKSGENGKGLKSRWYPKTLRDRILAINHIKKKLNFQKADGFNILEEEKNNARAVFFIDPPYVKAGRRLYTHYDIDHQRLFALTAELRGKYMLTYDDNEEIRKMIKKYKLDFRLIPMKTTHHVQKNEIIISDNFSWW